VKGPTVSHPSTSKRRRFTPIAILAGLAGTAIVALSLGASLSGLIATITNSTNTAATAAMAIQETSGANTCNSYDATTTCSTINKYGGTATPMVPGGTAQTVTVNFANTGTVNATTATLVPGTCTATSTGVVGAQTPTTPNTTAGNLCSVLNIAVYKGATATGTALYNGPASGFTASVALGALNAGANQSYTFVTSLPSSATTAVQGQQVSQPLVWTYNQ
jgi:hypothetical protein